jgi:hypothetical protein
MQDSAEAERRDRRQRSPSRSERPAATTDDEHPRESALTKNNELPNVVAQCD